MPTLGKWRWSIGRYWRLGFWRRISVYRPQKCKPFSHVHCRYHGKDRKTIKNVEHNSMQPQRRKLQFILERRWRNPWAPHRTLASKHRIDLPTRSKRKERLSKGAKEKRRTQVRPWLGLIIRAFLGPHPRSTWHLTDILIVIIKII